MLINFEKLVQGQYCSLFVGVFISHITEAMNEMDNSVLMMVMCCVLLNLKIASKTMCVTGASVHAPRQRNSTYVQTVRWYIYKTRRPEHTPLPIHWYKKRPQGPPATAPLHGILPGHGPTLRLRLRLRLQSIKITASTAPLRQDPAHCCISYPTLSPSLALTVPCWQPFPTGFDSPIFWFD